MASESIKCLDCGKDFPFTDRDRTFYAEKGWTERPKRCRSCREARRAAKDAERPEGDKPAALHATTCTECGGEALVPFRPREGRSVFCADCYRPPQRTK